MRASGTAGAIYQLTLTTYAGRPILRKAARAALFCRVLGQLRGRLGFALYAYVVLPDRVRMIVGVDDGHPRTVRMVVQRLKSRFAREINSRSGRCELVWQDGAETAPLASPALIARRAVLLHRLPIVARLADDAGAWRWSSYGAWSGAGHSPLRIEFPEGHGLRVIG